MTDPGQTALYRFLDADSQPIYIGITDNIVARFRRHKYAEWWPLKTRSTIDWYPSRAEAEAAERLAIETESPRYNIRYSTANGIGSREARRNLAFLLRRAETGEIVLLARHGETVAFIGPAALVIPYGNIITETSVRNLRRDLTAIISNAACGQVTFITSRGSRMAVLAPASMVPSVLPPGSLADELERLYGLLGRGVLTRAEFEQAKRLLLDRP